MIRRVVDIIRFRRAIEQRAVQFVVMEGQI
jgi:hypothetical protein